MRKKEPRLKTAYQRRFLYPHRLAREDVHILDIVHSLSAQPRYNGHTPEPFSVAQHSIMVSQLCAPEDARKGLTHDFAEAYLGDLGEPIKHRMRQDGITWFDDVEWETTQTIWSALGIPFDPDVPEMPPSVRWADLAALVLEIHSFFGDRDPVKSWDLPEEVGGQPLPRPVNGRLFATNIHTGWFSDYIVPLPWKEAKGRLLKRYNELFHE